MTKKKKKVLFVATVDSHIELFHLPYLKMFHDKGWEVHVATETGKKIQYCDKKIKLPIKRSPFKLVSNYKAVRRLRQVMKKEGYSIVHCHTPMGGVVARLAGKKCRRDGTRMIYTAHGFHFYTGAPLHYWLMFYPVEWYLAKYTDTLITINNEDYERAQAKFGRRCRDIQYVPGVGVDEKKFEKKMSASEKRDLRESLGLKDEDKVLICVGRLDKNKNQGFLIKAMPELLEHDDKYHLLLVGPDELNGKYQKLAEKLGVSDNVHFLGYRDDIPELMQISNVAVSASKREGLPVNLIEAAMAGLSIVATDCRGNRDVCMAVGGTVVKEESSGNFIKQFELNQHDSTLKNHSLNDYAIHSICKRLFLIYGFSTHRLSIIIPVYNCENYVASCVNSILKQKNGYDLEIIIVDDGSFDTSGQICDSLANACEIVTVYHRNNNGVSAARNYGIKKSTGDYIYFVDSDDVLLDGCIDSIMEAVAFSPDVVSIGYEKMNDTEIATVHKNNHFTQKTTNNISETEFRFSLCQNVFRKTILIQNKLILNENLKFAEDMDLCLEILMRAKKIRIINGNLYGYRNNIYSATSTVSLKRIDDMIYFIDKWHRRLLEVDDNAVQKCLGTFLAYQFLILSGMIDICSDSKKKYEEKVGDYRSLLRYHGTIKTKIGYAFYKLLGINLTFMLMGRVLALKGVVKEGADA